MDTGNTHLDCNTDSQSNRQQSTQPTAWPKPTVLLCPLERLRHSCVGHCTTETQVLLLLLHTPRAQQVSTHQRFTRLSFTFLFHQIQRQPVYRNISTTWKATHQISLWHNPLFLQTTLQPQCNKELRNQLQILCFVTYEVAFLFHKRSGLHKQGISSFTTILRYLRALSTKPQDRLFGKGDVYLFTLQRGQHLVATAPFIDKYIVHYSGEWLRPLPCFALKNVFVPLQLPLAEQSVVLALPLRLKIDNKQIAVRHVFTSIHLLISLCYSPLPTHLSLSSGLALILYTASIKMKLGNSDSSNVFLKHEKNHWFYI